jgi:nucleoside-diphosphate-sugar epimerase
METVHHVHAEDVAQAFWKAIDNWSNAVGESFHVVSPAALTLRGYAESMATWFGQPANLRFVPWEQWRTTVSDGDAESTWDHIAHSPNCSITKARRLLDYQPRYTSLQGVFEAVEWLIGQEAIKTMSIDHES